MILGIDTGGTYTDAVLLDNDKVVSKGKALTTHYNLMVGIKESIEKLNKDFLSEVSSVILSTTLATNSIVELRRLEKVKEVLIGYDRNFFLKSIKIPGWLELEFVDGMIDISGNEVLPLDIEGLRKIPEHEYPVAISGYMSPINPKYEEMAKSILKEKSSYPVVCGHELSGELNSIKRAITTALNASLIPSISRFIKDVQDVMKEKGIDANVFIVNADGSIVDVEEAMEKPIKTVLSGPAASSIGGVFLSGIENGIVVDMGGTTTDISLIENSVPMLSKEGAKVGTWDLLLPSLKMRTVGLGGDSRIYPYRDSIEIGPTRVIPISILSSIFPDIKKKLKIKVDSSLVPPNEFILKLREPSFDLNQIEEKLLNNLNSEPISIEEATRICNLSHPYILNNAIQRLEEMGIIIRSGFTPTDVLNYVGECQIGDVEAGAMATRAFSNLQENIAQLIKKSIIKKMTIEILRYLFLIDYKDDNLEGLLGSIINSSITGDFRHIMPEFSLPMPIVGIGAPIKSFIYDVAKLLHTEAIVPEHYEVANAVGAGSGRVLRVLELEIVPIVVGAEIKGYRINGLDRRFSEFEDAKNYAINYGRETISSLVSRLLKGQGSEVKIEISPGIGGDRSVIKILGIGRVQ
jgi:N-methylhydantoinase A/oxoprolinase/acetone carboxylase beta subunit